MFVDIVGSTEIISGLDPEQSLARLKPALEIMCTTVMRFDGTVARAMGDGIMALFGAPRAQEGHAFLACEAALAIQTEFSRNGRETMVRIGLHSGDLLSGILDLDPTREASAHGLTVHIASRLQAIAEPGGICISEDCYRIVGPYCDAQLLGLQVLKGVPEQIKTYSLRGLKPAVASQQFHGTKLASFRGREHELSRLRHLVQNTNTTDVRVIGISGSPGSGKSRLCYEFAEWCRRRTIPVLEARAQLYGHARPLHPVLDFFRLLFGISPNDDALFSRQRIAQRVLEVAPTFETDLSVLNDFLGISDAEGVVSQLSPKSRQVRLLEIVRHMVKHFGTANSVIIVEDLQWLDEASEDFVTTLVEAVAGSRTILVLNYRPEYRALWMKWAYFQELCITELSAKATSLLVEELIAGRQDLQHIRTRVAERSGGNPFFAEELVRSLAEDGADFSGARLSSPDAHSGHDILPATVQAVIGARIDRLGEKEKQVLQTGAIIGKEFPLVILQEVASPFVRKLDTVLDHLCGAELLQERAATVGRQFAFRHPLVQEVAYAAQTKTRRRVLHASVAKAMEDFYQDRIDEFAGLISYHFESAGAFLEAADYAARAAKWLGSTNPAQAIKYWQQVRVLLQQQPRTPEIDSLRIFANAQIAWLGWREGMTANTAQKYTVEALDWARAANDEMIPILLLVDGRITVAGGGAADTYVDRVQEALSLLRREKNAGGRIATLNCALSQAYGCAGLLNDALTASNAAMQGLSQVSSFDHQFLGYNVDHWVMSLRGRILVRLGRFAEAEQCLDMLLQIEQTLLDPTVRFIPHFGYVDLAWCCGDAELAERHASRVSEIAGKTEIPYLQVYAFACEGTARSIANDFAGAEREFSQGLKFLRKTSAVMEYESEILASLADCYYQMGQPRRAQATAKEAIELAQRRCTRLPECRATITYAAALLAEHGGTRLEEAESLFRRAEDLIRITGAEIYQPLLTRERARISELAG
jgi:adenylate cyclase